MQQFLIGLVLIGLLVGLSGCFDDPTLAPVVNAWHQPHSASSDYVVRGDDTIYSIAWAFGLDYRALAKVNHLVPPYGLSPGQHLVMTTTPVGGTFKPIQITRYSRAIKPVLNSTIQDQVVSSHWRWPAQGHVFQWFSTNPSGHPGISIRGRFASPVRAAADGIVVYSGDGVRGYGNLIIVKHNNRYLSAYGFNERNLVFVGDRVRMGQVIARMGKNDAARTLLYFEIRRDGVPVDPMRFL